MLSSGDAAAGAELTRPPSGQRGTPRTTSSAAAAGEELTVTRTVEDDVKGWSQFEKEV
jgi:hypothetical protein